MHVCRNVQFKTLRSVMNASVKFDIIVPSTETDTNRRVIYQMEALFTRPSA